MSLPRNTVLKELATRAIIAIDRGQSMTMQDAGESIIAGKIGEDVGQLADTVRLNGLIDADTNAAIREAYEGLDSRGDITRKLGVENNGLAMVAALAVELIE
ncbi:MAG: hypothetical protein AAGG38_07230 [Planctomycetota bacterium]